MSEGTNNSNPKQLIADTYNVSKKSLTKVKKFGVENFGIFYDNEYCYKITPSLKECIVAKKLINCDFKNVVKVLDVKKTTMYQHNHKFIVYIIKEERLFNVKNKHSYNDLNLSTIMVDVEQRMEYYVQILNGVLQLATIGVKHNDLHPDNVMVDKGGNAKIFDFGICSICKKKTKKQLELTLYVKE